MPLPASFLAYASIWLLFLAVPAARAVVIWQVRRLPRVLRALFWMGMACGAALAIVDAILLVQVGAYAYTGPGRITARAFVANLAWVTAVASTEEMILRGLLLTRLRQFTNGMVAVAITAVVFAIMHVGRADFSAFGVLQYFVDGLLFGWIALTTGDIWGGTGVHLGKNLGVALLFGGSKHLIDPVLVATSTSSASNAVSNSADIGAYLIVVPVCVLVFSRAAVKNVTAHSGEGPN